jgi:recombination protein RecR
VRSASGAGAAPSPTRTSRSTSSGTSAYPQSVTRLIDEFAHLPGIGRRSAERLAFHVLKAPKDDALNLSRAIADVKQKVRPCRICYNLTDWSAGSTHVPGAADDGLCRVCADETRDRATVMVIEQPKDLIALEQTGAYKGIYHVLMGRIAPLEGVGPGDLTIHDLIQRVDDPGRNAGGVSIREIVLALNPTLEGDGTGLYLGDALARKGVKVTRLARGVPAGSHLEFASKAVLADAILERRSMD